MQQVVIYATAKAPYHKDGETIKTDPKMAEFFLSRGYATTEKVEATQAEAEKVQVSDTKINSKSKGKKNEKDN